MAASMFELGKHNVDVIPRYPNDDDASSNSSPPKPVLVFSPTDSATYPVLLFLHGFLLHNSYYRQLLRHVASHGFIIVAPQLSTSLIPSSSEEDVATAAAVANWLPQGLQPSLPPGVSADLRHLALAGHSRGGHAAFALALGHAHTTLKFSALLGVDPVAGQSKLIQVQPKILTFAPSSFDLGGLPVLVLGTGLGSQWNAVLPPCAPPAVSHDEFYRECRPPCYHVVVKEYGHLDMLDDDAIPVPQVVCKCGSGGKDL